MEQCVICLEQPKLLEPKCLRIVVVVVVVIVLVVVLVVVVVEVYFSYFFAGSLSSRRPAPQPCARKPHAPPAVPRFRAPRPTDLCHRMTSPEGLHIGEGGLRKDRACPHPCLTQQPPPSTATVSPKASCVHCRAPCPCAVSVRRVLLTVG